MITRFKIFEKSESENRLGVYVTKENIFDLINFLENLDINRYTILYGKDDDDDDQKYFLVLLNGNEHEKLPYVTRFLNRKPYKDYYCIIDYSEVYPNWFNLENITGDWKIINSKEDIGFEIETDKYNL